MSGFSQVQENQEIVRRHAQLYVQQAISQIDAKIAKKSHLWMETY